MLFKIKSGQVLNTETIVRIEPVDHSQKVNGKIDLLKAFESRVHFNIEHFFSTELYPDTVDEILEAARTESLRLQKGPGGLG